MGGRSAGDGAGGAAPFGVPPPGFRLPASTAPGRVRLQVADLERSLGFYRDVLGFRTGTVQTRRAELGAVASATATGPGSVGGTLVELVEHEGAAPVPRGGRPGLYHFAILLPTRAALGCFARHLAESGTRFGASDHLVSEALYLQDPDGLGIEVYADRPPEHWRHRNRQLVMTTEPLDMESLLDAAGDEPWAGMPAGTVIGHIHLHVGDLERAAEFYHGALGLDRTVWNYPGALFLSAGGYHHHLGLNHWARGTEPPGAGDAQLLEWELSVPTVEAARGAMASLAAAGFPVAEEPGGGVVRDPWGIALRIRIRPEQASADFAPP